SVRGVGGAAGRGLALIEGERSRLAERDRPGWSLHWVAPPAAPLMNRAWQAWTAGTGIAGVVAGGGAQGPGKAPGARFGPERSMRVTSSTLFVHEVTRIPGSAPNPRPGVR
ncbi:MAG TPA: hypothetical protein VNT55_05585, partial [Baekduia sp.]|nr:hypothetical protein [Baekduia sp.]